MNHTSVPRVFVLVASIAVFSAFAQAQQASSGIAAVPTTQATPSNVIAFSDALPGQADGAVTATFALYPDSQSTAPAWTETQVVQISQGKYSVLLGSATASGIPADVFAADQAHWLGVQINGTEKRYLLVSVPYAMKAMEAERLGGLLPSQFVTTAQLQVALENAATSGSTTTTSGTKTVSGPVANASLNPPEPATDFIDNNTTEVLLVTQQGTGFAIHAISAGDAALFGENTTPTGTAVKALASGTSGANIGLLAQSASPSGIAAVVDNTGNGKILSLRSNGNEVGGMDNFGNFTANQINATTFFGNGFGLFGIPPAAVNAQSASIANTIVMRDSSGSFSANQINASVFFGNGFGLFGIPPAAVNAQSANVASTIVVRDSSGSFTANQINASTFFGNGFGLFGIPPSAVNAQSGNIASTIVMRDSSGSFAANQINAGVFFGNGFGLFGITPAGVNAQSTNVANTIVMRDSFGNFTANQINGSFIGLGNGLFGIPPAAVGAQSQNVASSIVMRDASGNFAAGGIQAFGTTDFTAASSTAPVKAVTSANTPTTCFASRDLLIKTDALPGQQLFICNATGNGYVLVGDGTGAGVTSVSAGDGSVAIGGTAAAPTVAVANGGVTSAKLAPGAVTSGSIANGSITSTQLAPNAVTAANIANGSVTNTQLAPGAVTSINVADGALPPAKIAGTAATLGANNFTGIQSIVGGLNLNGDFHFQGQNNSSIYLRSLSGVAIQIDQSNTGPAGVGIAIRSDYDSIDASSNFGPAVNAFGSTSGVFARGTTGVTAQGFSVGLAATSLDQSGTGTAAVFSNLAKGKILSALLDSTEVFNVDTSGNMQSSGALSTKYPDSGTVLNGPVQLLPNGAASKTTGANTSGGVIGIAISSPDSNGNVAIAYSGRASCVFDGTNVPTPGDFAGISSVQPGTCTDLGRNPQSGGQVLGRILMPPPNTPPSQLAPVLLVSTQGDNDPTLSINTGAGLSGGPITSSGTISIANAGVTNSMLQNSSVTVNPGSGLTGGGTIPLGGSVTLSNAGALSFNGRTGSILPQAGDYSFSQINGAVTPSQLPSGIIYNNTNNNFFGRQVVTGSFAVSDTSAASGSEAMEVFSQNNVAGAFISGGPYVFIAQSSSNGAGINVTGDGTLHATGNVVGGAFVGDGSALTNVNAASIGGTSLANLASASALSAETASRQSADAALATSVSAETAARQADTNTLQTNITNVSAADAKLAAANSFTASNTFTGGTQDFSAAGATLPVRTLPSAQTPSTCVAGKELLIKTDAPAGQQLFLCDAGGTTWNLVGDGASGGVTSFNGRNGAVSPSSGDYSFGQISGSLATSQLPALTGDVTATAGSGFTLLAPTGVTSGAYTKVTVDLKGRVVNGTQASFSDLLGSATQSQLPVNVVYNNQANTFAGGLTVNGSVVATFFNGNGGGLTSVNAATLNNLASSSFAQLSAASNTFTGGVTAPSFSGNGSALTNVNAATVNNLQMLKLSASLTPANVTNQSCAEQSFTVSGVNSGDVVLSIQPAGHSVGTNIAIGGWRVSAANTVAIQFCNVSRSNSTPTSGTYTIALMR